MLKEGIKDLVKFGNALAEKLEDGKISLTEAIDLLIKSTSLADEIQNYKLLIEEYKSLSFDEKQGLVNDLSEEFDIKNDEIEEIIEAVVHWLVALDRVIEAAKKL